MVDYAIASYTVASCATNVSMGDALLIMSAYCPLTLSVALLAPPGYPTFSTAYPASLLGTRYSNTLVGAP